METKTTSNANAVINAYTGGACITQKGTGGWAFILTRGEKSLRRSGGEINTTSNRVELIAAIKALEVIKSKYPESPIVVYTDSQYLRNGITEWIANWKRNGWRKNDRKPVQNVDLWSQLDALNELMNVSWEWVKEHRDNPLNNEADRMAYEAIPKN